MAQRGETASGITQRVKVLKDAWINSSGEVVDQSGNTVPQVAAVAPLMLDVSATAAAVANNRARLLERLALGGNIVMGTESGGAFGIDQSLIGYDSSRITLLPNSRIALASSINLPLFVTENWQSSQVTVTNGITDYASGTYTFACSGITVTPTRGATYTHNSLTFTVISTSISGGAGTITAQATGAPLGSGTLTKSGGTGDASITFNSGTTSIPALPGMRLAVADCGSNAHNMTAGKSLLAKGDTNRRYLGVRKIDRVIDAYTLGWYEYEKVAIGASAGTVTIEKANSDIWTEGGNWDRNGQYNQAVYDYTAHALIFNKCGNSGVRDARVINAPKYCVYAINTDGFQAQRLWFDNASDGVHLHGFTKSALVRTVRGNSADDFVAYTPTNDGYEQYDIPSGSMPGDCYGLTIEDIQPNRCGEDVVAVYAVGSYALEDVVVRRVGLDGGKAKRLFVLSPPSASAAAPTAVGNVTLEQFYGKASTENVRLGQYGVQLTAKTIDISGISIGSAFDLSTGVVNCTNLTFTKLSVKPKHRNTFDITVNRYLLQTDETCVLGDVDIDHEADTTGSGGAHVVAHWGGASLTKCDARVRLVGTAHMFDSAAGGNPEINLHDWATTTYSLVRVNWPCRLRVHGGRASAPAGTPPVLLYGSGYTFTVSGVTTTPLIGATYTNNGQTFTVVACGITSGAGTIFCTGTGSPAASGTLTRASGTGDASVTFSAFVGLTMDFAHSFNDWGTATNFVQYGTAAADNLSVNEWDYGGLSTAASNTASRTWTSTSGTFRLRGSVAWCQHDASKWTSINNGCHYYNNSTSYGVGVGAYAMGPSGFRALSTTTQAVTSAANASALNCRLGNIVTQTLQENTTWGAPTNVPTVGETVTITITQDATGGRTTAWNAAYIFPTAWSDTGNTANKKSTIRFVSDGTKLIAQGANSWY